jgi:hypothetical protein
MDSEKKPDKIIRGNTVYFLIDAYISANACIAQELGSQLADLHETVQDLLTTTRRQRKYNQSITARYIAMELYGANDANFFEDHVMTCADFVLDTEDTVIETIERDDAATARSEARRIAIDKFGTQK